MVAAEKNGIIAKLQTDILRLQGFHWVTNEGNSSGLDFMQDAFPNGKFPVGCIHEFLSGNKENIAATSGFISGLISSWLHAKGAIIWISTNRTLFPPALKLFGIEPDRFIFIDLIREKDILWAMEEALKCGAVTAVVGEVPEITFNHSRRLQLAVEESQVTGFILNHARHLSTTACVSRWKISSQPSTPISSHPDLSKAVEALPGIGFPKWKVELLRMRNGKSGVWEMEFINGKFVPASTMKQESGIYELHPYQSEKQIGEKKTG